MSTDVYIVKAHEEELGEELFQVVFPVNTPRTEALERLEMASRYAWVIYGDEASDYDEYFDKMLEVKECSNGLSTFIYYLELRGCTVTKIETPVDFEFEW